MKLYHCYYEQLTQFAVKLLSNTVCTSLTPRHHISSNKWRFPDLVEGSTTNGAGIHLIQEAISISVPARTCPDVDFPFQKELCIHIHGDGQPGCLYKNEARSYECVGGPPVSFRFISQTGVLATYSWIEGVLWTEGMITP